MSQKQGDSGVVAQAWNPRPVSREQAARPSREAVTADGTCCHPVGAKWRLRPQTNTGLVLCGSFPPLCGHRKQPPAVTAQGKVSATCGARVSSPSRLHRAWVKGLPPHAPHCRLFHACRGQFDLSSRKASLIGKPPHAL